MATIAGTPRGALPAAVQDERRFYLRMAIALALIVLAGFGGYILAGISSFAAPWWVHFHAVVYMGWIVLYLGQNLMVVRGDMAVHRRVGALLAGWSLLMVVLGFAIMELSIAAGRAPPPVFTAPFLLAMDGVNVLVFAGLVWAGLALRHRSDWHRRLMLCATISIIAPGIGRLTVLTVGFSWPLIVALQLGLVAIAAAYDWRRRGAVHPALLCGAAAIAATGVLAVVLADVRMVVDHAAALQAG